LAALPAATSCPDAVDDGVREAPAERSAAAELADAAPFDASLFEAAGIPLDCAPSVVPPYTLPPPSKYPPTGRDAPSLPTGTGAVAAAALPLSLCPEAAEDPLDWTPGEGDEALGA